VFDKKSRLCSVDGVHIRLLVDLQEEILGAVIGVDGDGGAGETHLAVQDVVPVGDVEEPHQGGGDGAGGELLLGELVDGGGLDLGDEETVFLGELVREVGLRLGEGDAVGGGVVGDLHRQILYLFLIKNQDISPIKHQWLAVIPANVAMMNVRKDPFGKVGLELGSDMLHSSL